MTLDYEFDQAHKGYPSAQYSLGMRCLHGVPKDSTEAVKWFRKAAEQEHADAQIKLGLMYTNGDGVPQDHIEAMKWFRMAAKNGKKVPYTMPYELGLMYAKGEGVPQDHIEAMKWFHRAAKRGNADAQYELGWTYANGLSLPQDDIEAAKWYRMAAEQGHADAQYNLGLMYEKCWGVTQDDTEAAKWFSMAADQGHAAAQINLKLMYAKGWGVPQNYVEAATNFNRSDELAGHPETTFGSQIETSGIYIGRLTMAKERIAKTGTRGIEFIFEAEDGRLARNLTLWVAHANGEKIEYPYSLLSALMVILDVKKIESTSATVDEWNSESGMMVLTEVQMFMALMNKPIGVLLQREEGRLEVETNFSMKFVQFFDPNDRSTPAEILFGTRSGKALDKLIYKLREAQKTNVMTSALGDALNPPHHGN